MAELHLINESILNAWFNEGGDISNLNSSFCIGSIIDHILAQIVRMSALAVCQNALKDPFFCLFFLCKFLRTHYCCPDHLHS